MAAESAALAKEFEAKVEEAVATLEKLSQADWKKVTEAEKWSVGVTATTWPASLNRSPA